MTKGKVIFFIALFACITSCVTENEEKVTAIIRTNRIYPSLVPAVSDSEYVIVKSLFKRYKISLSGLKVYRFLVNRDYKDYHVRCYQYYISNGFMDDLFELFACDVVFNFYEGRDYYYKGGELIDNLQINVKPRVTMAEASNLFYKEMKTDWWYKDSLASYSIKGFNAELGLYNLNAGISNAPHNFVLAWRLTANNEYGYPRAYIRADYLKLIHYTNGIIIN